MRASRRPRRTAPLTTALTTLAVGTLLVVGATSSVAAPSASSTSTATPAGAAVSTLAASTTPSPAPDDADPEGLPWPGIIVGGGLGLVAGTVLMVLSKRREDRD